MAHAYLWDRTLKRDWELPASSLSATIEEIVLSKEIKKIS